jgi:two-component system response regulator AtoC
MSEVRVVGDGPNGRVNGLPGAAREGLATVSRDVAPPRERPFRGQPEPYRSTYDGAFGNSARMRAIKDVIDRVAGTDATVLVWGESGVGKALVARAIHDGSPRRAGAFVQVNCAALPGELLESELFGHERGAFTGAHRRHPGKFELADGGTILLDEIGEVPVELQAKLLHVLQDHEFAPLGSDRDIKVDVRVVAATNRDLEAAVARGAFREDLYHRLNVIDIFVPPLRDRPEEIPILAEYFRQKYTREYNRQRVDLSGELLDAFREHAWPGNVRMLENLVKRVVLLGSEALAIQGLAGRGATGRAAGIAGGLGALDPGHGALEAPAGTVTGTPAASIPALGLKEVGRRAAREAERCMIAQGLDEVRWNRTEAARRLRISYKALLYKIRMCGLAPTWPGMGTGAPSMAPGPDASGA